MAGHTELLVIGVLSLVAVVLFGWIVPLVVGLVRHARGAGGRGALIGAGVWFLVSALLVAGAAMAWVRAMRSAGAGWPEVAFDVRSHDGATGTLVMASAPAGFSVLLHDAKAEKSYRVEGVRGRAGVPAGDFEVSWISCTATSQSQRVWTASCWDGLPGVAVPADGEGELAAGPPLSARVEVAPADEGQHRFDLVIKDAGGRRFSLQPSGESVEGEALGFELLGADGVAMWSGTFEYG